MSEQALTATAKKTAIAFFDAVEAGRIEEAVSFLAQDVQVWHNIDDKIVDRNATGRTLSFLHKALADIRYENRRLGVWAGGFSEQHFLVGKRRSDGAPVRLAAAIICNVDEHGMITRFDEYFDSKGQAEFGKGYKRQPKL
ncbi:hypothetical protein Micbo1qcDRAFT_223750 [Microdochium bolleyi]|uniref:SnoaL-like domain-containing protein n=1 Tax=Microdochium bolleyi TaxID=196109 RepID=A0A136J304_9PEZI|nr:hypothetical protein Micbo1qcDRAFT_223750 [Microdochium bolleyi]